jgi:hypothetical protein
MANSSAMTTSSLGKRKRDEKSSTPSQPSRSYVVPMVVGGKQVDESRSPIHKHKTLSLPRHLDPRLSPSRLASMYALINHQIPADERRAQFAGAVGQPLLKIRRLISKRDRRPLRESSSTNGTSSTTAPPPPPRDDGSSGLLQRCHICAKAPRMKKDLDGYKDCWRCRRRTCYVCVRMCETTHCGGRKICRACCVEVGEDGDVFCLDCFGSLDDYQMGGCA